MSWIAESTPVHVVSEEWGRGNLVCYFGMFPDKGESELYVEWTLSEDIVDTHLRAWWKRRECERSCRPRDVACSLDEGGEFRLGERVDWRGSRCAEYFSVLLKRLAPVWQARVSGLLVTKKVELCKEDAEVFFSLTLRRLNKLLDCEATLRAAHALALDIQMALLRTKADFPLHAQPTPVL